MNISHITEKTIFLETKNGKKIEVASLPKNARFEVDTLDRLNQQRMDILCQLETFELAIHSQKMKLTELIKSFTPEPLPEEQHHE